MSGRIILTKLTNENIAACRIRDSGEQDEKTGHEKGKQKDKTSKDTRACRM